MKSPADLDDEAWNAELLRALSRSLAATEDQGQLAVERADVAKGEVITILRFAGAPPRWRGQGPARPPTRRGRVVFVRWLREMLSPDATDHVAGSWIESPYTPDHPDPGTLVRLRPALRPPPTPRWQDDLPPGVNTDDVYFTRSYGTATTKPEPPPPPRERRPPERGADPGRSEGRVVWGLD